MKLTRSKVALLFVLLSGLVLALMTVVAAPTLANPWEDRRIAANMVQVSDEVFVPAGQFSMGCASDLSYELCDVDARPIHTVYLDAFYIDRTEVTNAQYRACEAAGACLPPVRNRSETRGDYYINPAYDNYPVIQVDRNRAIAYCQWVGKRLPTEAEWEKAARGTDLYVFPWGNDEPSCDLMNYIWGIEREYYCVGDTVAVGSYPENASPYGALDMTGNVSEWVNDIYASRYYYNSPYYNPQGPSSTDKNEGLVRGGSWNDTWRAVTTYVRLDESEIYKLYRIGIRCARSGTMPTPSPTPTPTPTPTPFAVGNIGSDGGALWLADSEHLTLLSAMPGVVDANTTFTIAFDGRQNPQEDLQGIDHFFSLSSSPSVSESETAGIPGSLGLPLKLTLGYTRSSLYGVITDTLSLYRLGSTAWLTDDIAVVERTGNYLVAWVGHTGVYGLMGRTNRLYLPILFRGND